MLQALQQAAVFGTRFVDVPAGAMFRIDSVQTPGIPRRLVLTGDLGPDARDELVRAVEGALVDVGGVELDLGDVTSIDRAVVCYLATMRGPTVSIVRAPAYVARWLGQEGRG